MTQEERIEYLVDYLLDESGYDVDKNDYPHLFQLYRALVNVREAKPISEDFLKVQDEMLQEESKRKGIVSFDDEEKLVFYQGDITRLKVGAIVNAANNQMEGCFSPLHSCIDNAIHTYAGIQLRNECHDIMQKQGILEPTGKAKITSAYNLPSDYVIHTVGPIIRGPLTSKDKAMLRSCYESCLRIAEENHIDSIAFCCISTGVFHFPQDEAAKIAVETVRDYLQHSSIKQVIFNVFKDEDKEIYEELLKM